MTPYLRTYQICTRTVMDTSDPEIRFDADGVSSHARRFDAEVSDNLLAAMAGERLSELRKAADRIRSDGAGKPYDSIVGVSGGVDSSYVALQAKKLGLRPLLVHFDSGWNTGIAEANVKNLVASLDLDLVVDTADWPEMRDLQLAFLRAGVPNVDIPTDHAFANVAFRQARKYRVTHILSGGNWVTESVLPTAWGHNAHDSRHLRDVHKKFGKLPLKQYPVTNEVSRRFILPHVYGIKTMRPLNYLPYQYEDAKLSLQSEVGWKDYGGKHQESVFTRYFQGYYLPTKFGFDKRRAHLSSLILANQITREAALAELERNSYEPELLAEDEAYVAGRLRITVDELRSLAQTQGRSHSEYKTNQRARDIVKKSFEVTGLSKAIRFADR